jgi:hypothetical protein
LLGDEDVSPDELQRLKTAIAQAESAPKEQRVRRKGRN